MLELREKVNVTLGWVLVVIMAVMVLNVLLQVAARYLGVSAPFTEELAGYLLVWVGLLGASYATGRNLHLAIDLLPRRSSEENQRRLNLIINTLVLLFALTAMVIGGLRLVYITLSLNQRSPVMEIPKGYIYTVVPISGLFIMFFSVLNMFSNPWKAQEEEQLPVE